MPRVRSHDPVAEPDDDDVLAHDIPTLLDSLPAVSTYTFSPEMTPASFNPLATPAPSPSIPPTLSPSSPGSDTQVFSVSALPSLARELSIPSSPMYPGSTHLRSHGKKRDASYIPRPPNAFILFRSSFIRSQRVPGNVEGNHSTLSKIIGKCWKALPREERERWEREAVAAQAEHRRKYPDWRFRPGANTVPTKFRIKDGTTTSRRRISHRRNKEADGERNNAEAEQSGRTREKGKGKARTKERSPAEEEERLEKITELLVDGKEGRELEIAIEEWEDGRRRMVGAPARPDQGTVVASGEASHSRSRTEDPMICFQLDDTPAEDSSRGSDSPSVTDSGGMPLSDWFKRSQSEPASAPAIPQEPATGPVLPSARSPVAAVGLTAGTHDRPSSDESECGWWSSHITSSEFTTDTTGLGYEGIQITPFDAEHVSRFQLDSPSDGSAALNWTKTSRGYLAAVQDPFLNDKRSSDVEPTPSVSDDLSPLSGDALPSAPILYPCEPQPPSSFSSLADWAGGVSAAGVSTHAHASEDKTDVYHLSESPYGLRYYGDW
ncbi:hypothetical protein APHAL10511_005358 [Amanita phalloides]|nr:hypothetical protein APHAL10511_005358 [Amanita phalloides]